MRTSWAEYQIITVRGILKSRARRELSDEEIAAGLDRMIMPPSLTTEAAARLYGVSMAAMIARIKKAGLSQVGRDHRDGRKGLWRASDIEAMMNRPDGRAKNGRRYAPNVPDGAEAPCASPM